MNQADANQDLLDRTLKLSRDTIELVTSLPDSLVNRELKKQLIRSITSIGANYREACEAESGKDFVHKIRIAKKECRESTYWLDLLLEANPKYKDKIAPLADETIQLLKIFSSISSKFKN